MSGPSQRAGAAVRFARFGMAGDVQPQEDAATQDEWPRSVQRELTMGAGVNLRVTVSALPVPSPAGPGWALIMII